jgi:hypothetical protein
MTSTNSRDASSRRKRVPVFLTHVSVNYLHITTNQKAYGKSKELDIGISMLETILESPHGRLGGHLAALDEVADFQVLSEVLLCSRKVFRGGLGDKTLYLGRKQSHRCYEKLTISSYWLGGHYE